MGADLEKVLITEEEILTKLDELAALIAREYEGKDLLLVGVLKGAVMVMADLMRALPMTAPVDWMAVSSYGSGTKSSGVVRILKDLDTDVAGRDVLVVADILDSGLTLSWLLRNLRSRNPASVEVITLLRKPDAVKVDVPVKYVGFDIPNEFVVGYGLDFADAYRGCAAWDPRPARLQLRPWTTARAFDSNGTRGERGALLACTRPWPAWAPGGRKTHEQEDRSASSAPTWTSSASSRPRCSGCWPSSW
jgi:hypoxanthine phosphoribosyltransferase